MTTLTTTATYQNGVLLPKVKPHFMPQEVVVVYVGARDNEEEEELSPAWKTMIDEAEEEVRQGKVIGPFDTAEELIASLRASS